MLLWTKPMSPNIPGSAIGRGAFRERPPRLSIASGNVRSSLTHAENVLAAMAREWGIPVNACHHGTLAGSFRRRLLVSKTPLLQSHGTGIAILLVQTLVDLASRSASVSIALAVVLGFELWPWGAGCGRGRERFAPRTPQLAGR